VNSQRREFDLIEWIRQRTPPSQGVELGIGDDTALFRQLDPEAGCLVTVDMLIEGVHFSFPSATPRQVGRKALGVNLSDIAAMAGQPTAAVVSLALPRGRGEELVEGLYDGLGDLAKQFDVAIVGGDTNSWNGPLVISVTVLGETVGKGAVTRRGARPGDWIFVTGELGGSLAGGHLDFIPRVEEALLLHEKFDLHAMIDVSDGLAADLNHIAEESHVGAILDEARIPISAAACKMQDDRSELQHALGDGEDFELLFTVSPADGRRLAASSPLGISVSHIGDIVEMQGLQLRSTDGSLHPLPMTGWEHTL